MPPPALHDAAHRLNAALGNTGRTVAYTQPLQLRGESLAALVDALRGRRVDSLIMLGTNPVYDAPGRLGFAEALARVPLKLHAGIHAETRRPTMSTGTCRCAIRWRTGPTRARRTAPPA